MATNDFFPRAPMRRVEGGIRARSTRGAIGSSWWSKRFLAVLESFALGSRLTRGKHYARAGQVLNLRVTPGEVRATVQGSRVRPYAVRIGLATFGDAVWAAVEERLAAQALFSARLLAGELPGEIEDVFAEAGAPLFPRALRDLAMSCSCPDSAVPCKHLAATFYLLAEAFDDDPFQVLLWRGRSRDVLLARLRELRDEETREHRPEGQVARKRRAAGDRKRASKGAAIQGSEMASQGREGASEDPEKVTRESASEEPERASREGASEDPEKVSRESASEEPERVNHGRVSGDDDADAAAPFGAAAALRDLPEPELAELVDRFWLSPVPLTGKPQPVLAVESDLLLRQLPAPGQRLGGRALADALRLLYKRFG